jgi:2-polyprenyl-6-methoxyphenol hydroxylase-like FAD-dependent oxidoreductase
MDTPNRAIIVGAGVGGLSTAAALKRVGIEAAVFDRHPALTDVGCVQIWSNGMVALHELGVSETMIERGLVMEEQVFRTAAGRVMMRAPVREIARSHGSLPPVNIRRLDMIKTVYESLDEGVVTFSSKCTGFEQDDEGVTVRFEDGREERGAILIGADGIFSAIRAQLGGGRARDSGAQVTRALLPFEHPEIPAGRFILTFGGPSRFGMIHTSPDVLCWFGIFLAPPGTKDAPEGRKAELLKRYRDFPSPIAEVIEGTVEETIYRADISDILPQSKWGEGRVTLLGDAAHAATPYLGRGAGEAVEDALIVAQRLGGVGSLADTAAVAAALRAYEQARMPATHRTQNTAWRFGKVGAWSNPVAYRLRDSLMSTVGRRVIHRAIHTEFGELGKKVASLGTGVPPAAR